MAKTLASGASLKDNTVRLWDAVTRATPTHASLDIRIRSIASRSGPDGQTLASGSRDGTVLLWEMDPSPVGFPRIVGDINRDSVVDIFRV